MDQRIGLRADLFLESYREPSHEIRLDLDTTTVCIDLGLTDTALARAQSTTIRLKRLKMVSDAG